MPPMSTKRNITGKPRKSQYRSIPYPVPEGAIITTQEPFGWILQEPAPDPYTKVWATCVTCGERSRTRKTIHELLRHDICGRTPCKRVYMRHLRRSRVREMEDAGIAVPHGRHGCWRAGVPLFTFGAWAPVVDLYELGTEVDLVCHRCVLEGINPPMSCRARPEDVRYSHGCKAHAGINRSDKQRLRDRLRDVASSDGLMAARQVLVEMGRIDAESGHVVMPY